MGTRHAGVPSAGRILGVPRAVSGRLAGGITAAALLDILAGIMTGIDPGVSLGPVPEGTP